MSKESEDPPAYEYPNNGNTQYNPQQGYGYPAPGQGYTAQQPGASACGTAGAVFTPQPGLVYPPPQPGPYGAAFIPQQQYLIQPGYGNFAIVPNDHCTFSVLNTIFCCFWIGLFAIIKSQAVRDAVRDGNLMAAAEHSQQALKLNKIALGVGIGVNVLVIVIVGVYVGITLQYAYD